MTASETEEPALWFDLTGFDCTEVSESLALLRLAGRWSSTLDLESTAVELSLETAEGETAVTPLDVESAGTRLRPEEPVTWRGSFGVPRSAVIASALFRLKCHGEVVELPTPGQAIGTLRRGSGGLDGELPPGARAVADPSELAVLREEVEAERQMRAEARKALATSRSYLASVERRLEEARAELVHQTEMVALAEGERAAERRALDEALASAANEIEVREQLDRQVGEREQVVASLREQLEEAEAQLTESGPQAERLALLERQLDTRDEADAELRKELELRRNEVERVQADSLRRADELEQSQQRLAELQRMLSDASALAERESARAAVLEQETQKSLAAENAARRQLDERQDQLDTLHAELAAREQALVEVERRVTGLQNELATARASVDHQGDLLATLHRQANERSVAEAAAEDRAETLRSELARAQAELARRADILVDAERSRAEAREYALKVRDDIDELRHRTVEDSKRCTALEDELSARSAAEASAQEAAEQQRVHAQALAAAAGQRASEADATLERLSEVRRNLSTTAAVTGSQGVAPSDRLIFQRKAARGQDCLASVQGEISSLKRELEAYSGRSERPPGSQNAAGDERSPSGQGPVRHEDALAEALLARDVLRGELLRVRSEVARRSTSIATTQQRVEALRARLEPRA